MVRNFRKLSECDIFCKNDLSQALFCFSPFFPLSSTSQTENENQSDVGPSEVHSRRASEILVEGRGCQWTKSRDRELGLDAKRGILPDDGKAASTPGAWCKRTGDGNDPASSAPIHHWPHPAPHDHPTCAAPIPAAGFGILSRVECWRCKTN